MFSHTFTFDQTTGLPAGMTFTRNGLNSYLGLGAITTNTVYTSRSDSKIPPEPGEIGMRLSPIKLI
ncbi:MAG: hypothetical protein IPG39_16200 [Bacteroidetes bacterium]|nr:hypothetical protein [Bacteroidota bacterium]